MLTDCKPSLTRQNDGWLSRPEQWAIAWAAPRIPRWISPNHLTALGFAGAVVAMLSYILAAHNPAWLWMVNAGLILNWFGDSLDGAVARLQRVERPRYGFFLDQSVDVVSQFLFALGLGLSGYVSMEIAALGLAAYLMMTVQSLLRAEVSRVFHLASAGIGLTEVRCMFIFINIVFYFVPPTPLHFVDLTMHYGDVLGVVWIFVNLGLYITILARLSRALGREEPLRPSDPSGGDRDT